MRTGVYNDQPSGLPLVAGLAVLIGIAFSMCSGCGAEDLQRDVFTGLIGYYLQEEPRDGIDGKDGEPGRDGMAGDHGEPGADGVVGPEGEQGVQGVPGPTGARGPAGTPGRVEDPVADCRTLCHHGHTITVDEHAIAAHLAHHDTCGACPEL